MKIKDVFGIKVLNSRGEWTIKVFVQSEESVGSFIVPAGKSKGKYEVIYLPVDIALKRLRDVKEHLIKANNIDTENQEFVDLLLWELGGGKMSKIGGNTSIGISIANLVCASYDNEMEVFDYVSYKYKTKQSFPTPMFNVINGGLHSGSKLSFQEFLIIPIEGNFLEKIETAVEFYGELKKYLKEKYGKFSINVGDEGGFVPRIEKNTEAIEILEKISEKIGRKIKIGLDVAANSFFKNGKYIVDGGELDEEDYFNYIQTLVNEHEIFYIEDPFPEDKPELFKKLKKETKATVVGDDLFVTNPIRLEEFLDCANGIIIKPNQVGTITDTMKTIEIARKNGYKIVVSHRSGDSEDTFISDFAYGVGSDFVKFGAPARGERTSKYNRLLEIYQIG